MLCHRERSIKKDDRMISRHLVPTSRAAPGFRRWSPVEPNRARPSASRGPGGLFALRLSGVPDSCLSKSPFRGFTLARLQMFPQMTTHIPALASRLPILADLVSNRLDAEATFRLQTHTWSLRV